MNYLKIKILIILFFFLFFSNAQSENVDLVNKISKNLRCLIWQGQSVYDSQSDFAISMKIAIKKKIDEGYTENQIYDYLVDQYGEWISYNPGFNKNTIFLWLLPILTFIVGGWLIFKKTKFFKL